VELPAVQRERIEAALHGVSRSALADRAAAMSEGYRARGAAEADALAYVAVRAPATYAAVRAVLAEITARWPSFAPITMLDLGAGPGSASWAAAEAWPSIESFTRLERDATFIALGRRLTDDDGVWQQTDIAASGDWPPCDLVVLAYVATELADLAGAVRRAYDATDEVLVIVEPGTPAGFRRLLEMRRALLGARATLLAPCPHEDICPLAPGPGGSGGSTPDLGDWCHFSQRVARSRLHREVKRASAPWEEERYCYLAFTRSSDDRRAGARVLAPPRVSKGEVAVDLCTPTGRDRRVVRRRDRAAYGVARKLRWGSGLDPATAHLVG
jgi:ribosomal protein RSM22 (predicted rRNA methylase)